AGRSGERSFPSPGMYGLRESRCSKHRSERDSSNQRFHGVSPPNAFTMSGFAHLLSSSNWGEKLLPSIKSRVGVRGISHCTVKVHPRPLYEQLRQLTTHVEHSRLDGVCRDGNDLGYLFDCLVLEIDEIHHFTMSGDEHHCSPPSEFVLMNRKTTVVQFTMKCSARHNDWTY